MKLIEAYANSCGVRIPSEPVEPYTSFCPVPFSKYITFHPSSGMDSKNYDYYSEVMADIAPTLNELGYSVIQLGSPEDGLFSGCYDLRGKTNLYQASYLIKNAILHFGSDSVWAHVAGIFKTPSVVPYGPTYSNVCSPYYRGKFVAIESPRKGHRASCLGSEDPKTINFIMPEEISNSILYLLGVEKRISRKTLFLGKEYNNFKLNFIPETPAVPREFGNCLVDIRGDLLFNPDAIVSVSSSLKCNLHISQSRTFDAKLFSNKQNINSVIFHIKTPEEALAAVPVLKFIKANFTYLVEYEGDESSIGAARCHLFDFNFSTPKSFKSPLETEDKFFFKSKNIFCSDDKIYLSKYHYDNKISQESIDSNIGEVIDHPDFWSGLESYMLYK